MLAHISLCSLTQIIGIFSNDHYKRTCITEVNDKHLFVILNFTFKWTLPIFFCFKADITRKPCAVEKVTNVVIDYATASKLDDRTSKIKKSIVSPDTIS